VVDFHLVSLGSVAQLSLKSVPAYVEGIFNACFTEHSYSVVIERNFNVLADVPTTPKKALVPALKTCICIWREDRGHPLAWRFNAGHI
jgi:hypothetical protein